MAFGLVMDRLRAFLRRLTTPGERRTALVKSDDPRYELFYDSAGRLILEFRPGPAGTLPAQLELSPAQHDRWVQDGPSYIRALYEQASQQHKPDAMPPFDPAVAERLVREYPAVIRTRVAHHLSQYGAERPSAPRVHAAILTLARGDVHEVKRHVRNATIDYRDVLQQAGDFDQVQPLAEGALGIDPATGEIRAAGVTISTESTPADLKAAALVDEGPDVVPETTYLSLKRALDLGGAFFDVALVFEHDGLAEAHLTMVGDDRLAAWVRERLGGTDRIFSWGKFDFEQEGATPASLVLRYRY